MMSYHEHSQLQCALEERASSYINTLAEAFYGPMDELSAKVFQLDLLDGIDDYEIQGRRFAELKVQELKNKWVIALRGVLDGDASMFPDLDDAMAELLLRGIEPPYGSVHRSRRTKLRPTPIIQLSMGMNNDDQAHWLA